MPDDTELTVGATAAVLGLTVRTLHHWDEIGIARPTSRSAAGYRLYTEADLERLRRIVVYRELGLGLDEVRAVLDDPATDVVSALRAQRAQLAERVERLTALGGELDTMITAHERGIVLSDEEQTAAFGPGWNPSWPAEARERWGDSAEWQQYAERSAGRAPGDWKAVADASAAAERALAEAMAAGVEPGSPEADELVERHRAAFSAYFPISRSKHVVLGRLYEGDPAFAAHYDGLRPGLAAWLRRSIDASARSHGIDPETAEWE
ncbi:MerR family transcriptional regulator [Herbiconiux sp. A18JL235]|uniref:MerR family transcriptional regulator n=1 Tax=Herbiconiux sp. A18JL235 TaxID=3152363 RepID=A0AB39BKD8_9MICO